MKLEDITEERLESIGYICPIRSVRIGHHPSRFDVRVQLTDGKFQSAQLGIQCEACGKFHLTRLIENGFLSLRRTEIKAT